MNRFKIWLYGRFLPAWCREDCLDGIASAQARVRELREENRRLRVYIDGMHDALRLCRVAGGRAHRGAGMDAGDARRAGVGVDERDARRACEEER